MPRLPSIPVSVWGGHRLPMAAAVVLAVLAAFPLARARAEDPATLAREGERNMRLRQYRIAREYFRAALQQSPQDNELWRKYDLCSERLFLMMHGRSTEEASAAASGPTTQASGGATGTTTQPAEGRTEAGEGAAPESPTPPVTEETPAAPAAPSRPPGAEAHSPIDIIYLERPIGTYQNTPAAANEEGAVPVTVRTATYELTGISFSVDSSNVLHCMGKMKNIGDREMRNAKVSVIVYDRALNVLGQGLAYVGVPYGQRGGVAPIIFSGEDRDFDVPIPGMLSTVAAYRIQLTL